VFAEGDGYLFDIARNVAPDFAKRIGFYKLRAKVTVADLSAERQVAAAWGGAAPSIDGTTAPDPRLATLGYRSVIAAGALPSVPGFSPATEAEYDARRIALGVPEGGIDFAFGESFPHDADMDQLDAVAFKKGCYVGQEVVSRMEHRGTARRRIVKASGGAALPPAGTAVTAGGKAIGTLASSAGEAGLALIRIDRAKEALDAGLDVVAGDMPIRLSLPEWARFGWTAAPAED
jgi:folate-binding protein YgfZ